MKERLVGAVILVGLIVALVPEMLSGPRRETTPARASTGEAVRTYTIDLAPPAPASASVTVDAVEEPPATAPDGVASQAEPAESAAPRAEAAPPATEPAPEAGAALPEPATPAPRPSTRPQSKPDPEPDSRPALETGWVVQLGSFASRENAERLAAEVRKGGYRAFVSRFESGRRVRYRVRVGPEQDRAQAEAVAQRLQRDGRQVSIVSHP